jgi:hypothetical protein
MKIENEIQNGNELMETLEFSELNDLKGGAAKKKEAGNAGGLVCWCSGSTTEEEAEE